MKDRVPVAESRTKPGQIPCQACEGSGVEEINPMLGGFMVKGCSSCKGKGWVVQAPTK